MMSNNIPTLRVFWGNGTDGVLYNRSEPQRQPQRPVSLRER